MYARNTPRINEVVLLDEPGIPRGIWKLAKIIGLKRERDRKIRAVELKLPNGNIVIRPINLLYSLELQDTNETEMPEEDKKNVLRAKEAER
ncbi:unnamed protein product [Brugia pahangi]|uniref:DUF5641 domain-containing protein n=1 Tax=Brugia pahangi TaxID=6280 RepID=A0A0N4T930_BRUPA|nr:unnamed protein product [Brugia pahangi]